MKASASAVCWHERPRPAVPSLGIVPTLPIALLVGAEPGRIGLKGSPTRVVSTQAASISRSGRRIAWSEDGGRLQREILEALA